MNTNPIPLFTLNPGWALLPARQGRIGTCQCRPLLTVSRAQTISRAPLKMAVVDYKSLESRLEEMKTNITNRNVHADADKVVSLYKQFCALQTRGDELKRQRNENAGKMKAVGKMTPQEKAQVIDEGKNIKAMIAEVEEQLVSVEQEMTIHAANLPNFTHPDVPIGEESQAAVLHVNGNQKTFDFQVEDHLAIGARLDLFDFENAARVTGPKFYYLRNAAALLEIALINWAMTETVKNGFTPMTTPDLARDSVVSGCGFNPRGESSQVYTLNNSDLCLVGTAEIPLGGYYADQIVDKEKLPIKMAAFSHCFRLEAGAAGAASRGLYRVHQFSKVEMFVLAAPEDSDKIHMELLEIEKNMFSKLGLHFKVLDMPTQDLGNPAYRKFDIEAWMPGRGSYGEISSASNCTDFQARRLNIKYKHDHNDNRYVHTLNGTACAIPRIILAILENYQQPDGSVTIPEVLRPFMGGMERIPSSKQ